MTMGVERISKFLFDFRRLPDADATPTALSVATAVISQITIRCGDYFHIFVLE